MKGPVSENHRASDAETWIGQPVESRRLLQRGGYVSLNAFAAVDRHGRARRVGILKYLCACWVDIELKPGVTQSYALADTSWSINAGIPPRRTKGWPTARRHLTRQASLTGR